MTQTTIDDYRTELVTDGGMDADQISNEDLDQAFDADAQTIGDIWTGTFIYTSWGYGQTNVELAQITEVSATGKTVKARLVTPAIVTRSRGSESLRPTGEQYGDEFRLYVRNSGGKPVFRGSYPYINGEMDEGTRKDSFLPFKTVAGYTVHQTPTGYGH